MNKKNLQKFMFSTSMVNYLQQLFSMQTATPIHKREDQDSPVIDNNLQALADTLQQLSQYPGYLLIYTCIL